jgi:hypothetical protein
MISNSTLLNSCFSTAVLLTLTQRHAISGICCYCDSGNSRCLSDVLPMALWNRHGEDHDKINAHRSGGGLAGGRGHDSHGSKWSAHWRISTSAVEPESLWLLRLPSSPLWLSSSLLPSPLLCLLSSPLPSPSLVSLLKETLRPPRAAFFFNAIDFAADRRSASSSK